MLNFLDSPYRGALSEAVLLMQESGEISAMKIKWWKEKRGGGACTVCKQKNWFINLLKITFLQKTAAEGGADELTVANVGGVFVVLMSGGGVAVLVSIFEMLYDVKNRASELEVLSTNILIMFCYSRFYFSHVGSLPTRINCRNEIHWQV